MTAETPMFSVETPQKPANKTLFTRETAKEAVRKSWLPGSKRFQPKEKPQPEPSNPEDGSNDTGLTPQAVRLARVQDELIEKMTGNGPFKIVAFELTHDGESWSVNTPFCIGNELDRAGTISRLRSRWEIFKANYLPKARVSDLADISCEDDACNLEVDCVAFADVSWPHVHQWGPVEQARMTGNPHRKCSCGEITLDLA